MNILSFGEILWDVFGDEKKIGGAPFNFASHCSKLGSNVDFISAVGNDELGKNAIENIKKMGISEKTTAVLNQYSTGICSVSLNKENIPHYDLKMDVAYDHIPVQKFLKEYDAIYFGTLASRSRGETEKTRTWILENIKAKEIFFDVNIRQNFWSLDLISIMLSQCTILKVSREEIHIFGSQSIESICNSIMNKYSNIKLIIVTLDKDGAMVYKKDGILYSQKPSVHVVSTVGAGDSFSACFLYNYLCGNSLEICLSHAVTLSSFVVTQLGAIPDYPDDLLKKLI